MKINKNLLLMSLVLGMFIISFLSAAGYDATETNLTIASPAANSAIAGTALVINCSMRQDVNMNYTLAYFYAKSTLTANNSWSRIGTGYNNTIWDFNGTINTASVEDANNYVFNCSITNGTSWITKTATGITVDNTAPATPTMTPADASTDADGTFDLIATSTGSTVTSCILYFDGTNPGEPNYAMTHSGNTCSYTFTAVPEQTYKWYVILSDGSNTTTGSRTTLNINIPSGTNYVPQTTTSSGTSTSGLFDNKILLIGIGAVVVIFIFIIMAASSGSKRRR